MGDATQPQAQNQPSSQSTPLVLSKTSIPALTSGLDASDVLECYALVRPAMLHGFGNATIKVQKMAVGIRYRPASTAPNYKSPMELTLEFGPQRLGTGLQEESLPFVVQVEDNGPSAGAGAGGTGGGNNRRESDGLSPTPADAIPSPSPYAHLTWENEGRIYYTRQITPGTYTSAYYMASMTGAVLDTLLREAVNFSSSRRRYQPFAVYTSSSGSGSGTGGGDQNPVDGTASLLLQLKSSSSGDFTYYIWQTLVNLGVEVEPILEPPVYEARLHVTGIRPVQSEPAITHQAATFYQRLYQCIEAIATNNHSKYSTPVPTSAPDVTNTTTPTMAPGIKNDENGDGAADESGIYPNDDVGGGGNDHADDSDKELNPDEGDEDGGGNQDGDINKDKGGSSVPDTDDGYRRRRGLHKSVRHLSRRLKLPRPDDIATVVEKELSIRSESEDPETDETVESLSASESASVDLDSAEGNKASIAGADEKITASSVSAPESTSAPTTTPTSTSTPSAQHAGSDVNTDSSTSSSSSTSAQDAQQAADEAKAKANEAKEAAKTDGGTKAADAAQAAAEAAQKAADATSNAAAKAAMDGLLSGDGAIMSSIISTCFSNPRYGISQLGENGTIYAPAYLYKDGSRYYQLNMTSPFIQVVRVRQPLPKPENSSKSVVTGGGGDFVDWILALVFLFGVFLGMAMLLQQVGYRVFGALYRCQRWYFHPRKVYRDDDEISQNVAIFGEDAIPLSMGGRATASPIRHVELNSSVSGRSFSDHLDMPGLSSNGAKSPIGRSPLTFRKNSSSMGESDFGDLELQPMGCVSPVQSTKRKYSDEDSLASMNDDEILSPTVPNRFMRDPDLVDLPDLKSMTKVAVPVGVKVKHSNSLSSDDGQDL